MTCNINCIYKSGEYICAFSKKLNGQRSTRSFCDVVLVAEEVVFPAHRSVLAAATEYFQVMFNINMTEKTQSRIHLSGASSDALGRLLDYIYTGSLHITKESVVNLIFLSSLLMMFDVAEYCWKYFLGSLDIQNCVERKMLADSISCEEVSKRVTAFVLKNFARLDAKALVTCPVNVMSELLSHEDLFVEKELEALKVFLEWCTHDLSGREKVAKNLLNSVRFSFLSLSQESLETLLRNYGISRGSNIYDLILKRAETNCGLLEARLSYKEERVIFVAGGHGENSILNQVTGYVPSSGKWYELSEMNYPRRSFGLVLINEDLIAVGGTMEKVLDRPIPFIERYKPRQDTWEEIHITSTNELERDHSGIVDFRGNIIIAGGFVVASGVVVSSVIELNPHNGNWKRLASLNIAREGHVVVADHENIYVVGGRNQSGILDSVERYDARSETWCAITSMSTRRCHACAVWFDNKIFVFGGYDGNSVLRSVEVYDPDNESWQALPDMLMPRMKFGVSVFNDHAYVAGGMKGSRGPMLSQIEKYSFGKSTWSTVTPMKEKKMEINCATINVPFRFLK